MLACGPGAAASHVSAAAAHGLLATSFRVVHITTPPGNGSASRPGIRVHRRRPLPEQDVVLVGPCRVTAVGRTLIDLGDVARPATLRKAFVRAEQLRILDMAAIAEVLARPGRRRGRAGCGS